MRSYQESWKILLKCLGELFDNLKEVFSAVNDFLEELSKKLKDYFDSISKNDNSAPLSYVVPAFPIIRDFASYASRFNRGKFIALILSFHLKILPINRLQRSGI